MTLKIVHILTKKTWEFTVFDNPKSAYFYAITISLPEDIEEGEYEYELISKDGDYIMSQGLMQIGNYNHISSDSGETMVNKTYNNEGNGVIFYEG